MTLRLIQPVGQGIVRARVKHVRLHYTLWHAKQPVAQLHARVCVQMQQLLGVTEYDLTVRSVSDKGIQRLNARFRGRREPTDVLAFPLIEVVHTLAWWRRVVGWWFFSGGF